jgi:hypothetical protein
MSCTLRCSVEITVECPLTVLRMLSLSLLVETLVSLIPCSTASTAVVDVELGFEAPPLTLVLIPISIGDSDSPSPPLGLMSSSTSDVELEAVEPALLGCAVLGMVTGLDCGLGGAVTAASYVGKLASSCVLITLGRPPPPALLPLVAAL